MRAIAGPLVAALMLAAVALGSRPCPALACSCVAPTSFEEHVGDPGIAVFIGTATERVGDNVAVAVEGWFKGPGSARVVLTSTGETTDPATGTTMVNTCGRPL